MHDTNESMHLFDQLKFVEWNIGNKNKFCWYSVNNGIILIILVINSIYSINENTNCDFVSIKVYEIWYFWNIEINWKSFLHKEKLQIALWIFLKILKYILN